MDRQALTHRTSPRIRMVMRTLVHHLLLCTALGLATTIALAWLLAAFLPHSSLSKRFNVAGTPAAYTSIYEFSRRGMVRRAWRDGYRTPGGGPQLWTDLQADASLKLGDRYTHDRSWGNLPHALDHPSPTSRGAEDARGWPSLCLWCTIDETAIETAAGGPFIRGGFLLSRPPTTTARIRALPILPIWPGLAANTIIFAAAWAVLIPTARAARSRVRLRRGRCPACNYDLARAPAAGCPECGWNRSRSGSTPS